MTEQNTIETFFVTLIEEEEWDCSYSTVVKINTKIYQVAWYLVDMRICDYMDNVWPCGEDEETALADLEEVYSQIKMHFNLMSECKSTKLCDVLDRIDEQVNYEKYVQNIEFPF